VERWCQARGRARGQTLPLERVWALSQVWYGTRMNADYRGRSAAQVEEVLASVGLDGPFWRF
jgi:hypothetical protein